jgi:hypothetical protein
MSENIIAWAGLGLIFLLCLPCAVVQRSLLAIYGLGLRLGMLALIAAAGYLWFAPTQLPTEIADVVRSAPLLKNILPEPGTPIFTVSAVALIAIAVLPLIAVIDVCRRAVGRRATVAATEAVRVQEALHVSDGRPAPAPYAPSKPPLRFGRRAAANALAKAGSTS